MRAFAKTWLPLLFVAAAACDPTSASAPGKWDVIGPVALDGKVAWVDPTEKLAFLLDPASTDLRPTMIELGKNAVLAQKRVSSNELLVVTRGQHDEVGQTAEAARLYALPADGAPVRTWDLPSRFDQMAQSTDGRYAVLFFSSSGVKGGGETLTDPNQVAVVDLASASGTTITPNSLRSLGGIPQSVAFSPPFLLHANDTEKRTLAVFLSGTYVTILDLTHRENGEISVDLKGSSTSQKAFSVTQVLFDVDAPLSATSHPAIYLRGNGSDDVVVVSLGEAQTGTQATTNDFHVSASLLAAGTGPADMALFQSSAGKRLLVVAPGSQELLVIDPATSRTTPVKLPTQANRILTFAEPSTNKPRALLMGLPPLPTTTLTFVDLDRVDDVLGQALDRHDMVAGAAQVMAYPAQGIVLVQHGNVTLSQLSLVDLGTRKVSPLNSLGYDTLTFVPQVPEQAGLSASDRLWVTHKQDPRVSFVTLKSLQTDSVRLDRSVESVVPVKGADGKWRLVVDHGGVGGDITILDAEIPSRSTARSMQGFLFTDYLARGAQ